MKITIDNFRVTRCQTDPPFWPTVASWDYFHAQLGILENGFLCVLCPITSIGLPSFPTMYNIIVFLAKVLEKFGLEYNLTRLFFLTVFTSKLNRKTT